jgi:hypothetical protein
MKLAEALLLRNDLQKKLESLRERISQYAVVQQGDRPHEDPHGLLAQAGGVLDELEKLIFRINQTNLRAQTIDGRSLTAALARRDALAQRHAVTKAAIEGSTREPTRYGLSEIKWVAVMDVSALQKQADDLARQLRELNVVIQEGNWRVELAEESAV